MEQRVVLEAFRKVAPSALTLGALASGLSAVRSAEEGDFQSSVNCVMAAAVLDGLDGHVARYLDACSEMGAELDSLCDLANFGVSPALVAYFWAKSLPRRETCSSDGCWAEDGFLWMACCAYAGCCALRLARFNIAGRAAEMDQQHLVEPGSRKLPTVAKAVKHNILQRKLYFQGIPAPVAAAYALLPMMLSFSRMPRLWNWHTGRLGTAATLLLTALLMVSPLPTLSSKMLKTDRNDSHLRSRHTVSSVAKLMLGLALCWTAWQFPFEIFLLLVFSHLLSLPLGVFLFYFCAGQSRRCERRED